MPKAGATDGTLSLVGLPKAKFFDIKNGFSDPIAPFPNTLPSADYFRKAARRLGLSRNSCIVVYDETGIYSSTRAWYLLKAFGHGNVAVLDGGLPEWRRLQYPTEPKGIPVRASGDFEANYDASYFLDFFMIQRNTETRERTLVDARSEARFQARVPERGKGLRSGTIPHSVNLPFTKVVQGSRMKPKTELETIFNEIDPNHRSMVFSCGSGVTACVLALAAHLTGRDSISVYDGSWTEYGSLVPE